MATSKEYVQQGIYVDYSRPWGSQTQYLCSSFGATVWANSLSILVTLAAARLFRLAYHVFAIRTSRPINGGHTAPERLLWNYILEHRADLPSDLRLGDVEINRLKKWKTPIVLLLLLGAFLAILSVGVLTAKIVTGSSALSAHPDCGIYEDGQHVASNRSANVSWVEAGDSQYRFDAEIESATYAQQCYHPGGNADGCDSFLQRSIPYTTAPTPCPFLDPSMCDLPGRNGAISFSTGTVDSRMLGLNAPRTLQFRRNATCSPVVVNGTFVSLARKGNLTQTRYFYGDLPDNPYGLTYTSNIMDPNIWVLSDYIVYVKMLRESERLPGLRTNFAFNTGLSLIFINQGFLNYPRPSSDPVFPALSEYKKDNWTYFYNAWYYNSILGCVDTREFKIPSQSDQWLNYGDDFHAHAASLKNAQERGTALLLEKALLYSATGQSIFFRQEDGLLARKLVKGRLSMALAEEQWKEEARNLFETSLARIQLDIKLMAFGTFVAYKGMRRVPGQDESICGQTFLFHSREAQSINLSSLIWITVVSSIIIILAVPLRDDGLLAEWLWTALGRCGLFIKQSSHDLVVKRIGKIYGRGTNIVLQNYRRQPR